MNRMLLASLVVLFVASPLAAQTRSDKQSRSGSIANSPTTEGYFTGADGVRLFYRRFGHGKSVVVLIHGGPGGDMSNGWEMQPLARGRTLILYDQRGGGRS